MPTHEEYRQAARSLCEEIERECYRKPRTDGVIRQTWRKAGQAGLFSGALPEAYGGMGNPEYSLIVMEELARCCILDFPFWLQGDVIGALVAHQGNEEQKSRYLPALAQGDLLFGMALTEDQGGSDIQGIATTARKVGGGYAITGKKRFISCGVIADAYVVAAQVEASDRNRLGLFLVQRNSSGLRVRPLHPGGGMTYLDMAELEFDSVFVGEDAQLGANGGASLAIMRALTVERLCCSIIPLQISAVVLREGVKWARERLSGGRSLFENPYIRFRLADFHTDIELAKGLVCRLSARYANRQRLSLPEVAMAKLRSVGTLVGLTQYLIKLYGARAFVGEPGHDVVKLHADALAMSIAGGTDEVMRVIIAESL